MRKHLIDSSPGEDCARCHFISNRLGFFPQAYCFYTGLLHFRMSIAFSQAYCLFIGLLHFHRPFAFSQTYCFFTGIMPIWFNWKKVIRKDPITTRNTTQLNFFNTGSASCFHSPPAPPATLSVLASPKQLSIRIRALLNTDPKHNTWERLGASLFQSRMFCKLCHIINFADKKLTKDDFCWGDSEWDFKVEPKLHNIYPPQFHLYQFNKYLLKLQCFAIETPNLCILSRPRILTLVIP